MKERPNSNDGNNFALFSDPEDYEFESDEKLSEAHILDAKYERVTGKQVADMQKHLSPTQREKLEKFLDKLKLRGSAIIRLICFFISLRRLPFAAAAKSVAFYKLFFRYYVGHLFCTG